MYVSSFFEGLALATGFGFKVELMICVYDHTHTRSGSTVLAQMTMFGRRFGVPSTSKILRVVEGLNRLFRFRKHR